MTSKPARDSLYAQKRTYAVGARFAADMCGASAMMFALSIIPLSILMGAAIDLGRVHTEGSRLQAAVDTAALAATRAYFDKVRAPDAERESAARLEGARMFAVAAAEAGARIRDASVEFRFLANDEIEAVASATVDLAFGGLLGQSEARISSIAASQVGDSRPTEVVLVLDNTASMFESERFNKMRAASIDFVDQLFDESPAPELVRVAVVPWSTVVNIDTEAVGGSNPAPAASANPPQAGTRTAPPAGATGRLPNLYDAYSGANMTAAKLDEMFAPAGWRGCVLGAAGEARISSSGAVLGARTDEPPAGMRWPVAWIRPEVSYRSEKQRDCCRAPRPTPTPNPVPTPNPNPNPNPNPDPGPRGPQGFLDLPSAPQPRYAERLEDSWASRMAALRATKVDAGCSVDEQPVDTGRRTDAGNPIMSCGSYATGMVSCSQSDDDGLRNAYVGDRVNCSSSGDGYTSTVDACVSDPNEFEYLAGGGRLCDWRDDILPWDANKPIVGPNLNCPTAILPLSGDRGQIIRKLDHMYPVPGGTQADVGLLWALRVLSPRVQWQSFFGVSGRDAPGDWHPKRTRKVMILLTDGQNVAPIDFEGYYGCTENNRGSAGDCWRHPDVDRLDDDALDRLTQATCDAIRGTYKVELYTIAVDVPTGRGTRLLESCAGGRDRFFDINADDLDETFASIAERYLRLTR